MDLASVITAIGGAISTLILGWLSTKVDWKKEKKKAEMQESDNAVSHIQKSNDEWQELYHDQRKTNVQLQKDYNELREQMFGLQTQVSKMNEKIEELKNGFSEKEKNYLLQITALQEENDDLREANECLKEKLKGGV
ncbi:MAG: hypothetical protein L0L14_10710 [Tetragenococcus koreensis]|nr:hypothetical protein [Tetragenococcus koreensis]